MPTKLFAIAIVVFGTILGSIGALFLKKSSDSLSFHPLKLINLNIILGFGFYAVSIVPFLLALKLADLSLLYPFVSLSYIWVALVSIFVLKEKMNLFKVIGIFFIVFGLFFIGISNA